MSAPPAIVVCCSKAGLAVVRSLGAHGIRVIGVWYGRTRLAASSRFVKSRYQAPDPDQDASGFTDFLLSLSSSLSGAVLFPTDDASLLALSRYKERLAGQYHVVAEDWPVVRQLLTKLSTYELATRYGVPCPLVQKIDNAADAAAFARDVGFPCLIKPSVGHTFFARYRAKMVLVHTLDELKDWISRLGEYSDELMLSEYIPGDDTSGVNYNSYYSGGRPFCEFTARKVRLKPERIGFPTVVKSCRVSEVLEHGRTMLETIRYRGFSCMEFKRDRRDGSYKLMEINARHNFSGMLALRCGLDFPYLSYADAIGAALPSPPADWPRDIFWIDEERDAKGLASSARHGPRAALAYAKPYLRKRVFAVFSSRDPLPSFRQATEAVLHTIKRKNGPDREAAARAAEKQAKA